METVLQEAERIIHGDRRQAYGGVKESFTKIAVVWSAILGNPVNASQVALCMTGLKLIREANRHKRDNVVDLIGYPAILAILEGDDKEERETNHGAAATTES